MRPHLSVVMPFYRNGRMLSRQYLVWALEWSAAIKEHVEIVLVDDGSPEPAADVPRLYSESLPSLSIYRIKEDKPWNQHGARNLGASVARGRWLLMTDMDHVIPEDTLAHVLTMADKGQAWTFERRDAPANEPWKSWHWSTMALTRKPDGAPKPHVNSFALARSAYWKVGGYDEDYCGVYGTDKLFRRRLWNRLKEVQSPFPLIRVGREVIPDASTSTLPRKEGRPVDSKARIAALKSARGEAGVIKLLQFEWERVL